MSTIRWTGDLDDDCHAEYAGMVAHCEAMSECWIKFDGERREKAECWFASVSLGPDDLFHSGSDGVMILGGHRARAICEAVMRAYEAGKKGRAK